MKLYAFLVNLLSGIIRFLFRVEVVGLENEPKEGSLMVCANHISNWDPVIVAVSLKARQVRYMAKSELFRIPGLNVLLKALGAYPVNRGAGDIRAIKHTIEMVKKGDCVGIFPQGTRHIGKDPRETEVKSGTGMCVYHAKCDVLPVAIVTKKRKMVPFSKTYIIIGKPIRYDELMMTDGDKEQFIGASRIIFDRICELINAGEKKYE